MAASPYPTLAEHQAIAASIDWVDAAMEQVREETHRLKWLQASVADTLLTSRVRAMTSTALEG